MYLFIIAGAIFIYVIYEIDSTRKKKGEPGVPVFGVIFDSIGFNVREEFDENGKPIKKKHKHHHHKKDHKKSSKGTKKSSKGKKHHDKKHKKKNGKKDGTASTAEKQSMSNAEPDSAVRTGQETQEIFAKAPEPQQPA
ncbi:hypothetical protein AAVH_01412 [Aphelenchoides avenae]|nr:hypothetical protein AAVH_01412 [Aphelenchus avenae]